MKLNPPLSVKFKIAKRASVLADPTLLFKELADISLIS
ncbi:hypothetical protein B599_0582 [Chlamydia psittaci MN]|nr:hypothetical protein B599_0582 [Chlamydia psittaci MN]EPJ24732.1 hypothetical protein CP09DC77_1002 [Chlamydia psittaci 09DC77]EPJ26470.1 hypothetical protein CP09DC80_0999 [Chlamydia psittaci 09DC80]